MKERMNNQGRRSGFTLVELLIVVGIVVAISAVSLTSLRGWQRGRTLNLTSQQIATLLREAETKAMSQVNGSSWGLHFERPLSGTPFYALFYTDTYGAATEVSRYPLPKSLMYDESGLASGEVVEIVFDQITGKPKHRKILSGGQAGTLTILTDPVIVTILPSNENVEASSTVSVDPGGTVAYDSFSCVFTCSYVSVVLPPAVTLGANPATVPPGNQQTTLSWSATPAVSCSAPWTASTGVTGSQIVSQSQTTNYVITCTGPGGSSMANVTVTSAPPSPPPPPPPPQGGSGGGHPGPMDQ